MNTIDNSWNSEFKELKKQLQKAYTTLGQCVKIWKELEKDSKTHVQRVSNLTEQYQCSEKVSKNSVLVLTQFQDVKGKLLFKIGTEIKEEMDQLKEQLSKLKDCSLCLTKQFENCMACYRRSCKAEDLQCIVRKTPLFPSVAEMLEWLQICERYIRESYLFKQYMLDTYNPDRCGEIDMFERSWAAGDSQQIVSIEDYLVYTASFMGLKLS